MRNFVFYSLLLFLKATELAKFWKLAKLLSKTRKREFVNKILKAMSFQIFAISERSKFWKKIAGKFWKANRWKNFESFLKANLWKIFESFWKLMSWQNFESKSLENFWKQIAGNFLKANRWKTFESFLKANRWKTFQSKTLAKFWKLFERSAILFLQWLLKAKRWQNFKSFLNARSYCFCNGCGKPRTNSSAFARENCETY